MSLCSFSSSLAMETSTLVDNTFINEFLPGAPDNAVKVYIYGLAMCSNPLSQDNSLDSMSTVLGLSEDQIFEHFAYWQEMGLVQIVNKVPFEIKYLSPKLNSGSSKIRTKAKYSDFNEQVQSILSGRMVKPIEFNEYYNLIELHHFEPEALIMIIKYCTTLKTNAISYPYILAVAKSFGNEGIKSAKALEDKLMEQEKASGHIKAVLKELGLNRDADLEERNMYLKWVNNFGFTQDVILSVAKTLKKKGGMNKLDQSLSKYFEQKLFTLQEIEEYSKEKENLYSIAKMVTSTLGLYYQNLESTVEVYIKEWVNKGYDEETLKLLSFYCYKQDIRNLSLMNEVINKFYKLGLISLSAINQYIDGVVQTDDDIKAILASLNIVRRVNSLDRDFYKTWTEEWHMPKEIISMVAEKSKTASQPLRYMNKLLSEMNSQNIHSTEEATKFLEKVYVSPKQSTSSDFEEREYTKEQLGALFDSLDDIEV